MQISWHLTFLIYIIQNNIISKMKKIFQKGKHHSSVFWKAFQIRINYLHIQNESIGHISRIFPSTKSHHNYYKIYDGTSGKIWRFLTWRHSPLLDPDSFLCWLSVKFIGRSRRVNFKARFRGQNEAEYENSFWISYLWVIEIPKL